MSTSCGNPPTSDSPLACSNVDKSVDYFRQMIPRCLAHAQEGKRQGRPIVGILCEFTPRELILAAGGIPVCLCGGSAKTIALAEQHLPANLCPLIKSTYGYHLARSNPFLEMADLIVAETTCDGKKKMYELMADTRPMFILELPHKPDAAEGFARWLGELERLKCHLEQQFHVEITPEKLRAAIGLMNRERRLRRDLAALMAAEVPPLTGRQLLDMRSSISGIAQDHIMYEETRRRLAGGGGGGEVRGVNPQRPVRVLMTGVPMVHGAERVLDLVESAGGLVVAMETCSGLKPILEDVDPAAQDPLRAIAEKYFHLPCSVMMRNTRRFDTLRHLAEVYRPDCIIELIWQACLTYDVESYYVRRLSEGELGIPYLRIETDYSPSDSARLVTRLEALYESVRHAPAASQVVP